MCYYKKNDERIKRAQSLIQRASGRCEEVRARTDLHSGGAVLNPSRRSRVCPLQLNEVRYLRINQGGNTSNFVPDGLFGLSGIFYLKGGRYEKQKKRHYLPLHLHSPRIGNDDILAHLGTGIQFAAVGIASAGLHYTLDCNNAAAGKIPQK